ncbi:thymidine phosphorylase [Psychromarinibacter sp. C21-152]|uniref:Thymidine phosphorylase n=1 Tax=Psychromarinibacter sediminicola TaxID=3033385 RepID=A0AAE3TA30_9RHOB|nr:thymidine phosphorylase [Psychromarinibacter sediminicola]MDF0602842.1 thymidine phosphorylase [Psychromarinibacter sediminicola]
MDARAILARLRRGDELSAKEVRWFAEGLASGAVSDSQAGAFAMAMCLLPRSDEERVALTLAMRDSGDVLDWDLPGPVLDKHSTGGVGDCVSLLLAPAMAALGTFVPMVSGRGLGHTGGTLDKMEAIPGLTTEVDEDRFRAITAEAGCAIVAASAHTAPADRRLYAVRDVTSTVESIDLITASILSKKLAAGLDALVLDVKVGSGAFMKSMEDALDLAESLVETANGAGCPASALITDMNQPCVPAVGNALEVMEVMEALTGGDTGSLICDLTGDLGGEMLRLAGMADSRAEGAEMVLQAIASGAAAERFGRMVKAMGGPGDFVDRWRDRLGSAPVVHAVPAPMAGYLTAIDGEALGNAVVRLGGGRMVAGDRVDPSVGLSDVALLGDPVDAGAPLAVVHAASEEDASDATTALAHAFTIEEALPDLPPMVYRSVP